MKTLIFYILLVCIFVSCTNKAEKQVVGKYYLINLDGGDATTVSYQLNSGNYIGIIPAPVVEVGFNDSFIIAKQGPEKDEKFYILPVDNSFDTLNPTKKLIGPLDSKEFVKEKVKLGLPRSLKFSIRQ